MENSPSKYNLAELTQHELREIRGLRPMILLPIGSLEDQGPHVFMGDYLCAQRIAEQMAMQASALGVRTLAAPPLPFGCNDYFGASVGGITLSSSTFRLVLQDMLASLMRHGFTRLMFINGHSGNCAPVHEVCRDLHLEQGVLIPSLYIWRVAGGLLPAIIGEERTKASGGHAANPLASVAMHLFPELVRQDLTPAPYERRTAIDLPIHKLGAVRFEGVDIDLPLEYDAATPTGVVGGDARLCSAETGQALVEKIVGLGARFIAHLAEADLQRSSR